MINYPPIPQHTGRFWGINGRHYAYTEPRQVIKWGWSTTFGRWGAVVEQSDGTQIFTYPEVIATAN